MLARHLLTGAALFGAVAAFGCAHEKSAPSPAAAEMAPNAGVESIVVTSTRRESRLREPLSMQPEVAHSESFDTEAYARVDENPFRLTTDAPLSTFSIDVDTASYANVRRFLESGSLPPADAVRIEEMLNYFTYEYAPPVDGAPFAVQSDVFGCPWTPAHKLVRVGLQAKEVPARERPAANLVFLVDVSGSMQEPNKLPLVKTALRMLAEQLDARDRVAMVVYAGASGVALEPTRGDARARIGEAIDRLEAGGSTNGGAGIDLAYTLAQAGHGPGTASRVILATDGDFNVGVTSEGELTRLIEQKAKAGVFLSVLGFGMGNYKDSTLEKLADRGNGNYAYVDTRNEARKALVEQLTGTLITVAQDVKIQVEWNPGQVGAYRLIGYENRALQDADFLDDAKDAGEIGAGHSVTALYEIVPPGAALPDGKVEPLKYQTRRAPTDPAFESELATVKLRWKAPNGETSRPLAVTVIDRASSLANVPSDARFAAAVASFGMLLRASPHRGDATFDSVLALAEPALGADPSGYRAEFVSLVRRAKELRALRAAVE